MPDLNGVIGSGSLSGKLGGKRTLSGAVQVGSTNVSNDHNLALNRDLPDQHPIDAITGLEDELLNRFDDAFVEEGYLILKRGDEALRLGPFAGGGGGGGGGGGNNAVLTMTNTTGWLSKTISEGADCVLSFTWSSLEDGLSTGEGTVSVTVGGATKISKSVSQGAVSLNVKDYLSQGGNKVRVTISDAYENSRTITFNITVAVLRISSYFTTSTPFVAGASVAYTYIPFGAMEKTVHFIVDSTEVGTDVVMISGAQQTYSLPAMTHGAHSLLVYYTAQIEGETVTSNELYYDMIVVDESDPTPIITSTFRATTASKFETLSIPYVVYTPYYLNSIVRFYVNGEQSGTEQSVDRLEHIWSYRADQTGPLTLSISTGNIIRTFSLTVNESDIKVEAVTDNLALYLTSYGRSNNEPTRSVWIDEQNNISANLTNFNFKSDGWQLDEDGVTVLRVSGDARVTIPYKPFREDFRTIGKTFEFEFATRSVRNYDAVLMSCMDDNRGFQITAQRAAYNSLASSISTQYKEDEHVRISFVIEKVSENRLIYVYINGIMSGVVQYLASSNEDFSQRNPVNISIGSNDCITDIYNIRIYDNDLTRQQIVNNWIADTQDISTMLARYQRNAIYDDYGAVTIGTLQKSLPYLPYLVMVCPQLPQFKGDKKTISGYYVDQMNESKSFSFTDAQADVQGTSSQYYPRKNYKIKFAGGFTMTSSGETVSKFAMRSDSIPTKTFTFKADVASSEGANNVELARLYNDTCPYKTPPQRTNSKVRQGIDGFPIVIFWDNGSSVSFLGKYNFNNDKGTEEVFGFADGDESWEVKNNTSDRVIWKSADYSGDAWLADFEARYPDLKPPYADSTRLSALAAWLVSTDQLAYTGDALLSPYEGVDGTVYTVDNAAYRLAKFKKEVWNYMEKDSTIFYYLFTELFLMVDSRAKNTFPTLMGGDKWCWLPYDFDTAIGINNEGALVFDYHLEDIDVDAGGSYIFNGQQSVLWTNLRQAFFDDIKEMYQTLRNNSGDRSLSYQSIESAFEEHQGKWSEAIFNEDSWFKYIDPYVYDGKNYLNMAQGSKEEQRKWWLYNRFRYIDSKYNAGDAKTDFITIRAYGTGDIVVTPYADIYATANFANSVTVSVRGERNKPSVLHCPFNLQDTEVYIYSASQLASIGDLSSFKVGLADFSDAIKMQELKIGDADPSYSNLNLYQLSLGNNTLLRTLDVRNCAGLGDTSLPDHEQTTVSLKGCTNIEHVYFGGTKLKGVELPNGGILKTLQLPSSIVAIQILNQPLLTNFSVDNDDYSNIQSLWIENSGLYVPYRDILETMPANSTVRVIGANIEVDSKEEAEAFMDILDSMRGLDEGGNPISKAVISGQMIVNDTVMQMWLDDMNDRYRDFTIYPSSIESDVVAYFSNTLTSWYDNVATTIRSYAFYNRSALTSVKTVATTVGSYAFGECTGLKTIDFLSDMPVTIQANAFNGSRINAVFLRSSSVCTLTNINAFENTPIIAGFGAIYVPEDLVDDYKEATNWSSLSNQIYPISMYPVTDFSTIVHSWEDILSNPNYATDYKIGDTKALDIGNTRVYMQIAAFNADDLADGSGKAKITWLSKTLPYKHRMNSTSTNGVSATDASQYNTGLEGWASTEMRYWLHETILPQFPEIVRNNIKEVNKTYFIRSTLAEATDPTVDKIWIPSLHETGWTLSGVTETTGPSYSVINSAAKRIRRTNTGVVDSWTDRSAFINSTVAFHKISADGSSARYNAIDAASSGYILIGFCT